MSKLEVDAIEPQSGTTLTLGASGDAVNIASGASITDFKSTGIDDNATSTAITIDSSEQVGIGTASPTSLLDVNGGASDYPPSSSGTGLFQCTAGASSTYSAYIGVTDDGVSFGHTGSSPRYLRFDTNETERMRITNDGNLAIGKTSATGKLEIFDSKNGSEASPHLRIQGSGYSSYHWLDTNAYYLGQASNSRSLRIYSGSNENAGAQLSAGGTSFGTYSDERLKKDITDLTNGLNKILALRPVNFKYKSDADDYRNRIGIIAQSLVGQVDEALDLSRLNDTDTTEYYNVRYQDLIPVLVKGMQEQQTKIQELEARITELENK